MAGSSVGVDVDEREVQRALDELKRRSRNLTPAWLDIGEHMLNVHRERFALQREPDGTPWQPLSPRYRARKHRNADKILILRGYLRDTLRYQVDHDGVAIGTDRIYGATHQFGDDSRGIPARPYLGFSDDDRRDALEILSEYLAGR